MSNRPLRFIHAADFHLEQPPSGIAAVPDALRELFLESAWLAAEKVFEVVLSEEAEFLVLCGDLLSPLKTGPRGPLFLSEQFKRLAQRAIPVYWAAGRVDPPELWPSAVPLPKRARLSGWPAGSNQLRSRRRSCGATGGRQPASRSQDAEQVEPDPAGLFTIAAVHGSVASESLRARHRLLGLGRKPYAQHAVHRPPHGPLSGNAPRAPARSMRCARLHARSS